MPLRPPLRPAPPVSSTRSGRTRVGLLAILLATLSAGLSGCSRGDADAPPDPLVTVDGLAITGDDFRRTYIDYLITTGQNDTRLARQRHYDALVDAYLLGAEADRRGLGDDPAARQAAQRARRRLVGSRYLETAAIDSLAPPTEAEAREGFTLSNEKRVVRQLFYRDLDEAEAAYRRLEGGRTFLEEAQALYATEDSSAGALGAIGYWQVDDAFAEAAFTTPVGAYSAPFRSRLGYHIVAVDDRLRNPVLTEDEFVRRRKGVESQIRLRRRRLEGDRFVRSFMEARDVRVDRGALQALADAIADLEGELPADAQQGGPAPFTADEKAELAGALSLSTPIATFEFGGERRTFTADDYLFWLDLLPFKEARARPGASLGRALRNEALALAGEAAGLADAPEVQHELARLQRLRLADALRQRLREEAPAEADTARLGQLARDLQLRRSTTLVDYWAIPFATRAEAEPALPELRARPRSANGYAGFEAYVERGLREAPALAAALRAAPLGEPVLAVAGEGWAVVRVSNRSSVSESSGAETLLPFAAEADLIKRLRREHPVEPDRSQLEALTTPPPVPSRSL